MKLSRLSGRKTVEHLRRKGQVWKGKHVKITFTKSEIPFDVAQDKLHPKSEKSVLYVGTIVSAKLEKSAVKRNRMRRRCREAMRVSLLTTPTFAKASVGRHYSLPTVQLLISPRISTLTCDFEELLADAHNFLKHIEKI
ncbi:MAG: ribonuclease P protein component [Patescibacteria group bacterium]